MTANDLRRLAESVDGDRGKDVVLVIEDNVLVPLPKTAKPPKDYVKVHTAKRCGGIQGNATLKIMLGGKEVPLNGKEPDAIFTSQAAIEKLVLPYYIRFRTPQEVDKLQDDLYQAKYVAAIHLPGSDSEGAEGPGMYGIERDGGVTLL